MSREVEGAASHVVTSLFERRHHYFPSCLYSLKSYATVSHPSPKFGPVEQEPQFVYNRGLIVVKE